MIQVTASTRPASPAEAWTRVALAVVGAMALGRIGHVHPALAPVVGAVWMYYAVSTRPARTAGLLALSVCAGLVLRAAMA